MGRVSDQLMFQRMRIEMLEKACFGGLLKIRAEYRQILFSPGLILLKHRTFTFLTTVWFFHTVFYSPWLPGLLGRSNRTDSFCEEEVITFLNYYLYLHSTNFNGWYKSGQTLYIPPVCCPWYNCIHQDFHRCVEIIES